MLTRRQRELVRLVARGLDRHEIAQELWVSPNTVKSHLLRLYKLVRVKNGAGLTTYGFTQGLLDPNEYR
jgi:DNA-binding NarL/FixJ family response regulator